MDVSQSDTWINGRHSDRIEVTDRGLQFGDGVFETLRVSGGAARYLGRHLRRLQTGCQRLGIGGLDFEALGGEISARAREAGEAVLKLIVTRGSGGRGYGCEPTLRANRILRLSALPPLPAEASDSGIRARLCRTRLALQPALAGIKHLNRLEQVLARREWDDPAIREGLLQDHDGRLIEGTMSNLFLVRGGELLTADLTGCGVAGVMRSVIFDLARTERLPCSRRALSVEQLRSAQEVFVCNSLIGIWPVCAVDGVGRYRVGPLTRRLQTRLAQAPEDIEGDWYAT